MDRKSIRKWAYVALAGVVAAVAVVLAVNAVHAYLYNTAALAGSRPHTPLALQTNQTGATFEQSLAVAGFAILVIALGLKMLPIVIALVTVIAVFQLLGGQGYQYIAYAFALGLALSSISRGVRPMIRMPTSVAMLLAVLGAVLVAFGDLSLFAAAVVYVADVVAALLAQYLVTMGAAGALAVVGYLIAVTYISRAVASAKGLAGAALSIAASLLGISVAAYLLQQLVAVALVGGIGVAVLLVASLVAIIDLFQALEKGRPEALIWAAPLAVLADAVWGISLAPIIAGIAGIAAVVAAFTLSDRYANMALILAISALAIA
jgi:hypothetical protein